MSELIFEHRTKLSVNQIKIQAEKLIKEALEEFQNLISSVDYKWEGNIFKFSGELIGSPVSGQVIVNDGLIRLEAELPLVAKLFESDIKEILNQKVKKFFS